MRIRRTNSRLLGRGKLLVIFLELARVVYATSHYYRLKEEDPRAEEKTVFTSLALPLPIGVQLCSARSVLSPPSRDATEIVGHGLIKVSSLAEYRSNHV